MRLIIVPTPAARARSALCHLSREQKARALAKASKGGKKGRASEKAASGAKRRRRPNSKRSPNLAALPFEEWDDFAGTGYVIESFDIRKVDIATALDTAARLAREYNWKPDQFDDTGWHPAYVRTHPRDIDQVNLFFNAFRGELIDWGVVVDTHQSETISGILKALEDIGPEDLYVEPIDDTPRVFTARSSLVPPPTLTVSDLGLANERVRVAINVVFLDFVWPLVAMAVYYAREAALIVGRDVAAEPKRYGLSRSAVPARRISVAERERLIRKAANSIRNYLKDILRDPAVVRRAGRRVEAERDHRAYCMRERLIHSEEFMRMHRNRRYALAKDRVIAEVIAPEQGGHSRANFQRIMDSGRAAHQRVAPNVPYCERWPMALEPSRKE